MQLVVTSDLQGSGGAALRDVACTPPHYCFHSFLFYKLGNYTLDFRVLEGKREHWSGKWMLKWYHTACAI